MKSIINPDRQRIMICLGLTAVIVAIYGQVWNFSFTSYDDHFYVSDNQMVRQGLSTASLHWAFTTITAGAWMPVNWLTHLLDYQLFGNWAGGHHLTNVFYHLANTLILFLLLARVTGKLWRSGAVAALFAVHPLHVESVAWVAERRDVLSTFWWLLTMWSYDRWLSQRNPKRYLLVMLCYALGLMVKATPVSLPLVLLAWDYWPLQRFSAGDRSSVSGQSSSRKQLAGILVEKIPLFLLAGFFSWLTIITVDAEGSLGSSTVYPWTFRIGNALVAYARYLLMTFVPVDLIPFYPYRVPLPAWQVAGAMLLLLAVSAFCWRMRRSKPYLPVGWFWYLIVMFPMIGVVQQGSGFALADRYTYVPLIGIFIMLVWGAASLAERYAIAPGKIASGASILLAVLVVLSFMQTSRWRDTASLFNYTLAIDPDNKVALSQLGVLARENGNFRQAHAYLDKAVRLDPDDFGAQGNFAKLLWMMGRSDEAVQHYSAAISLRPGVAEPYVDIAIIKAERGDLTGSAVYLGKAASLRPADLGIRYNLALVLYRQGKYAEAGQEYAAIIRKDPGFALAYNGLGLVDLVSGRQGEAVANFRAALRLDPNLQEAQENLELALSSMNQVK